MAISMSQAKSLCNASELALVAASSRSQLSSLTASQLRQKVTRARNLRDKWRDQFERQRRAAQSKQAARQTSASARSAKKAQLCHLGGAGVFLGQFLQRLVDQQQCVVIGVNSDIDFIQINPLPVATALFRALASGPFDEDAAHRLSRRRKEVRAIGKLNLGIFSGQTQPGFVNEGSGLEGVTGGFIGHFCGSQFAEFLINQRQQFLRGLGVATLNGL